MPELQSDTFSFHSEYRINDYRVILNLNNLMSLFKANENGEIISLTADMWNKVFVDGFH